MLKLRARRANSRGKPNRGLKGGTEKKETPARAAGGVLAGGGGKKERKTHRKRKRFSKGKCERILRRPGLGAIQDLKKTRKGPSGRATPEGWATSSQHQARAGSGS